MSWRWRNLPPPWFWWPGRGRGWCRRLWLYYMDPRWMYPPYYMTPDEREFLKYARENLENELKTVRERLSELEKTKK